MPQNNRNSNQGENTSKRGFASMDPERVSEIASMGGKASHKNDGNRGRRGNSGGNR